MKYSVGIDLGSTTTKAVILGDAGEVLGRGITNSRSNYGIACDIALGEALIDARFALVAAELEQAELVADRRGALLGEMDLGFREQQYRAQLAMFGEVIDRLLNSVPGAGELRPAVEWILAQMDAETAELYATDGNRKSDFFRDLAGARFMHLGEEATDRHQVSYDRVAGLFDKAILEVENRPPGKAEFGALARAVFERMGDVPAALRDAAARAGNVPLEQASSVGTGYGRQTLPFPKEQIRSEILCHGLGAHAMFPATRTVLDIGGQDTKAIQIDEKGIVTSFQMNDRCAAGCGRYLGYIADEMNLGVHELGPMACTARRAVRINSTCTVFAGAELRERLSLGEPRENILAGLHRAIVLRAMSLLARSGGVSDEFTFTGGVARNPAAVSALDQLVRENYGRLTTNISPDSIYTGALGAALFARRSLRHDEPLVVVPGGDA